MADIRPLRAWRYSPQRSARIEQYSSPLFDVVTEAQLAQLYQNPDNSIHLSVPKPGAEPVAEIVARWKREEIIELDAVPAIFPYYQHFTLPGESAPHVRKGFICLVRATPWGEGVVMRHESTIPDAVKDRLHTLRDSQMQVNPTHGLYHDPTFALEPLLDEAMAGPLYEVEDYQGVRDVLGVIQNRDQILKVLEVLRPCQIVLADGHHRYEASVALRKEMMSRPGHAHSGEEPWNYHLMYLTNDASPDLRIMATHRLLRGIGTWPIAEWRSRLEVFFDIRQVEDAADLPEMICGKPHCFGFVLPGANYKLRLKPGLVEKIEWHFDPVVQGLDLTVLHYYILWRILGIEGTQQRKSKHLAYERNFVRCLHQVEHGQADALIVTNPVDVASVRRVAELGQTMPPKSTYFYPKVLAGFVFSSLVNHEFYTTFDASLGLPTAPGALASRRP